MRPRVHFPVTRVAARESDLRNTFLLAGLLTLAALLLPLIVHSAPKPATKPAPEAAPGTAKERFTLSGTKVAVYNLAGVVTVEATTGTQTIVEVTRGGDDATELKMGTGSLDGRQTLRVIYPGTRIVYPEYGRGSNTSLRVRDDGTFGDHHDDWLGRTVRISGSGSGTEAHADLRLLVPKGTDVVVRHAVGDVRVTNVDAKLFLDLASGAVVSSGTHGDLSVDTGSGSVRVSHAQGEVNIDTGSGSVTVDDVKGGALSIDTGSGGVDATQLDVSSLSVDTGSGHVDLDEVKCSRVHVDTGSGGVSLGLTSDVEDVNIEAGSGEVELYLPKTAGAMLSLETGSGDMDVDLPLSHLRRDDGAMRAQMGDGEGRIVIETGSGGIRIQGHRVSGSK